ncbi:25437_t:CDS:2, partial [Gigaspora margarita]
MAIGLLYSAEEFFKCGRTETVKEAKISPKRDLILLILTKTEPTVIAPSRKVILELLECGTTNYGTNKVQKQIIDQELKQTSEIEELIENRHKKVIVKEASDSLVQNNENQMEVSFSSYNRPLEKSVNEINPKKKNIYSSIWVPESKETPSTMSQKSVVYNFIPWNIPKEAQANRIRSVYVQLTSKATSRIEALKK